jgi:hypothetical protein
MPDGTRAVLRDEWRRAERFGRSLELARLTARTFAVQRMTSASLPDALWMPSKAKWSARSSRYFYPRSWKSVAEPARHLLLSET